MKSVLSDFSEVYNGKTPSKIQQRDSGHPVLKIKDVDSFGHFKGVFESYVDSEVAEKSRKKYLAPGDILILNAAHNADYVGSKVYYASPEVEGALPTGEWLVIRPKVDLVDSRFLFYWIRSDNIRKKIRDVVKGIHLYPKDVAKLDVNFPSLSDQKSIATILDKADLIRQKRQRSLILLDELVESIFFEMFGDPVTNPKKIRSLPLTEICNLASGGTPSKSNKSFWVGNVPWFSPKDLKKDDLFDSIDHINEKVLHETNLKLLPKDTVVIVVRGMILAHTFPVCVLRVPATMNQDMKALLPKEQIDAQYLATCLRVQSGHALAQTSNSAHGTKRIDSDGLSKIRILLPEKDSIERFSNTVRRIHKLKENLISSHIESERLFNAMLSQFFQ